MGANSSTSTKPNAITIAKCASRVDTNSSTEAPHLLDIPVELLISVLERCNKSDILNMAKTCSYLLEVSVCSFTTSIITLLR